MQSTSEHDLAHCCVYPFLRDVSWHSSPLQSFSTSVLAEEERRGWFLGGRQCVSIAPRRDGGRVHYYAAKYLAEGVECQVVLHGAKSSYRPMRR